MALRDKIFEARDIPTEAVEVPEWGVTVEVRGMTGADRSRLMDMAITESGDVDVKVIYPEIVISTAYDPETGERVFTDDDADALQSKSAQAIDRIAEVGMRLSGFAKDSADKASKSVPDKS